MTGVKLVIINNVICVVVLLLAYSTAGVYGYEICSTAGIFDDPKICNDDQHCCGTFNDKCCYNFGIGPSQSTQQEVMEAIAALIVLLVITCCCVCCYRCCCRRTANRGYVYSTPGTTTAVSVSMPPQQPMTHQQVPYPTVVPYAQQTPYPPHYNPPTNPYYGMPPPAYGVTVQSEIQQSAPSAPHMQS